MLQGVSMFGRERNPLGSEKRLWKAVFYGLSDCGWQVSIAIAPTTTRFNFPPPSNIVVELRNYRNSLQSQSYLLPYRT